MAQLQMTATQQAALSVRVTDRRGNPAFVHDPAWTVSDAAVLALTVATEPLSASVAAVGITGTALVTFTADADLGVGVVPIMATLDVVVAPAMATVVEIQVGAVTEQTIATIQWP